MRILLFSPRFAPSNAADGHRARLLVRHLIPAGCEVEVLAVDPRDIPTPLDPWLAQQLPQRLVVHHVRATRFRCIGMNGLAQRSAIALYRAGSRLLATGKFDLVFFSTTEFLLHALGPLWQLRHGVPFCMDLQDPWVSDYYREHPNVIPPGGRFKFAAADRIHRCVEGSVVRRALGFVTVSEPYVQALVKRYGPRIASKPVLTRPFPAEPGEYSLELSKGQSNYSPTSAKVWRYVGRGGPDMALAAGAFFKAWDMAISSRLLTREGALFEAVGTSYAPAGTGRSSLRPLLDGCSLQQRVTEKSDRVGYKEMLTLLATSDALVVFGSDDPAYTASKIYPYLLSGRPLLAIFHRCSSVVALMENVGGGILVTFDENTTIEELSEAIYNKWFCNSWHERPIPLDANAFKPYTAEQQAYDLLTWFRFIISS